VKLAVDIDLTLKSAHRSFALNVAFSTADDRVVIFGPSGAGKSVTIQAIAGLVRPQEGRIVLGERVLFDSATKTDVPSRMRRVGYLFQDYALFPHLTVAENVAFPLQRMLQRRLTADQRRAVREMLDLFELSPLAQSLPRGLSGGQRQRVALARAPIREPEVLLLDEPFAALDVMLRDRVRQELSDLQARFRIPLVVITHDVDDVRMFAETLVVYGLGEVSRILPCKTLREQHGEAHAWRQMTEACGLFAA
jgi:molybdate transport system ATP-binding protein